MSEPLVKWSYQGDKGPHYWGHICDEYEIAKSGKNQSPVDIHMENVMEVQESLPLELNYKPTTYTVRRVENSVHLFPENKEQGLTFNGKRYNLIAFHGHIPSEHTLNQEYFAIEWHLVHMNEAGERLVLAIWMDEELEGSDFGELAEIFPQVFANFGIEKQISLDVSNLLPEKRAYFTYHGSLTTPPTFEGVTWIVLREATTISQEDFAAFQEVIQDTNRPLQALNDRDIHHSA
ncbi:carbonic anhydrase [Listeria booriae]|uniref:carbonic anhydrase n=1 Tax=Listeria booriae TaxID=1552123 RepID=UPI00162A3EAA|nr:carbonic anhydrase family protein [Listeria booriae]MBC1893040.1 carbonic anhydrase [Listeria booriae]MBC1896852.1 carbonic anhydrase [Listeria booriae]MBC2056514.1 carbonic anhydrase [Listeria booriae]MBC2066678.1 carbonic anhydrase [Listeria booriae]